MPGWGTPQRRFKEETLETTGWGVLLGVAVPALFAARLPLVFLKLHVELKHAVDEFDRRVSAGWNGAPAEHSPDCRERHLVSGPDSARSGFDAAAYYKTLGDAQFRDASPGEPTSEI